MLVSAAAVIAVLAVLALVGLTGGSSSKRSASTAPTPTYGSTGAATPRPTGGTPTVTGPAPPKNDPALWLGSNSAPVTIEEFGDFQCPHCASFARRTEPELRRRYVSAGVVRFIWRDYPWIGKESERAAIAARAAARQGKFWPYHDALYAHRFPENSGHLDDAYLRGIAQRLGLNMSRFDADRRDPGIRAQVRSEMGFAEALGMSGTPAFLINGTVLFGDQSLKTFVAAIEKARSER
ncbi:DsbA family protein [Actinoallomurus sp. NBC_01490]|uniref:DsbA family protein n=1 Tax=Actinoallomurus sp. NBC_01490 TaxID=2903557 RepID=UPI002E30A4D5|nr:thioredoxin domain-containing protein [Actinoallomurus sp. NBC_01490]